MSDTNGRDDGQERETKGSQTDKRQVLREIAVLGVKLNELMAILDPNLDQVVIHIHLEPNIVQVGKPAQVQQLFISRPMMIATLHAKKNLRGPSIIG